MKLAAIIATATILSASAASAMDLGNTGIALGAEVDTNYDFDADGIQSVLSPELAYSNWGATFTVGTDFDLVTNDTIVVMDAFDAPVIDLGAEYALGFGAKAYGGVNYDVDGNAFSGAKVGVSFAF